MSQPTFDIGQPAMLKNSLLALAFISMLSAAPASGPHFSSEYGEERARDFADMFRGRVMVPEKPGSFGFKARLTALLQIGAVNFKGRVHGMDRRQTGPWDQTNREAGVSVFYFSWTDSKPPQAGDCCPTGEVNLDPRHFHHNGWDDGRDRFFSLGLSIQPFILPGFDVGFYPSEAVDFALGLAGVDMLKDDHANPVARMTKPVMRGEPNFINRNDFTFPEAYEEDLQPYTFQSSPARERIKQREEAD